MNDHLGSSTLTTESLAEAEEASPDLPPPFGYTDEEVDSLNWAEHVEPLLEANAKLAGALDMVRETLQGGNVQDLLFIINEALATHRRVPEVFMTMLPDEKEAANAAYEEAISSQGKPAAG